MARGLRLFRVRNVVVGIPVATGVPSFTGTVQDGVQLTEAHATWTNSPTSYLYQHQYSADGVTGWTNIPGATSQNYTPDATYVSKYIRAGEKAVNASGPATNYAYGVAVGPVAAATGAFTVTGTSYGDNVYNMFKPALADTEVARTPLVPAEDEAIFIQQEMAPGWSPPASSYLVGGTDVAYWEAGAVAGSIRMKVAGRASIPRRDHVLTITPINAVGSGVAKTLTIHVPADNKCYFIDPTAANDAGNATTPALAKKFLPGSADYTGTAKVFTTGDYVFFKAGVQRTTHASSKTSVVFTSAGHTGGWFELNGWGGRYVLSGDKVLTGSVAATQAEVGGNTSYANIKKISLSAQGGIETWQNLFDGTTMLAEATFPQMADYASPVRIDTVSASGSELYGMRNLPVQYTGGTKRMFTNHATNPAAAGTTITIVDPQIALDFPNATTAADFPPMRKWGGGNFINDCTPASYNAATSTIVINSTDSITSPDGYGAYGFYQSKVHIKAAGQYGIDADGQTAYYWPAESGVISRSDLYQAIPWGHDGGVTYHGGSVQRFASGTLRSGGTNKNCGTIHWFGSGALKSGNNIINIWFLQNKIQDASLLYGQASGGVGLSGMQASRISLCLIDQCNSTSFIRLSCVWNGYVGGTTAQVRTSVDGSITDNWAKPKSLGQTFLLLLCGDGIYFARNGTRDFINTHGNIISLYDSSASAYIRNVVIEHNQLDNGNRFYTTETHTAGDRGVYVGGNMLLNTKDPTGLSVVQMNDGEPGGRICYNIAMSNQTGYTYRQAWQLGSGTGEFDHNIIAGLNSTSGQNWKGNVHDNLITINQTLTTPSTNGGSYTSNTMYTGGAELFICDGINLTSDMLTTLGGQRCGFFINA